MLSAPHVAWDAGPSTGDGDLAFTALRAREFARLDAHGEVGMPRLATHVARLARARNSGVALRGGWFCNPGAAEAAFGLDAKDLAARLLASREEFSLTRLAACLGSAVVAVRISLGLAKNRGDLERAVAVVASFAA